MQLVERIANRRYDGTLQPNKTPAENISIIVIVIIIIIIQAFVPQISFSSLHSTVRDVE